MRQMIFEGILVSLAGGALSLLVTSWTAKRLTDFVPPNSNPIVLNGSVDHNVVLAIPAAGCTRQHNLRRVTRMALVGYQRRGSAQR